LPLPLVTDYLPRKRPQLQQSTQYNIETTPENYVLTLSLPGNSAETTKIEISGSTEKTLTVTSRYPRSSIAYFAPQQFAVAEDVDSASVTAEFTNGLLTLTAPRFKPTVAEPVNVPIVQRDAAAALLEEGDEVAPDEMPEAPSPGDSEDVEVRFVEDEGEE
jgi:HSP20 family molecular chaperone IbpA